MALSDVLNNLTSARDALVTAINEKGGSLAATATLRQCAEAVTALPDGGGGQVFPAGYVLHAKLAGETVAETKQQIILNELSSYVYDNELNRNVLSGEAQIDLTGLVTSPGSARTVFGLFRFTDLDSNDLAAFILRSEDPQVYFSLYLNPTKSGTKYAGIRGYLDYGTILDVKTSGVESVWYGLALVYDGTTIKAYLNGQQAASTNISFHSSEFSRLVVCAGQGTLGSEFFCYNRALSEDEVKILASEFSPVVGELFFTTTEADGKVEGGYMAAGTGTLKLQLATGEITELSLTDTMQRAFSAYELSNVRVVSGAQSVTLLSINRIGIDYIDLSNFWSLEHLHMPISSSPEIKNLSSCHRLNYVDVGNSALSSAQVDQILSDILASNSHLNDESFSGSIDVSHNAVPTAAGLETIAQLESVGWSVNYDRE